MFKVITCATDGSAHGDQALDYAKRLAEHENAVLRVVHLVETIYGGKIAGQEAHLDEDQVIAKIKAQTRVLRSDGLDASLHVIRGGQGQPGQQIKVSARDAISDVLVIGSRGHSAIGGLLLGSVAQRLLRIAPCPILLIPTPDVTEPRASHADERVTASIGSPAVGDS